ncbi:MAG: ABC transporter permease [Pseudomonadota bacterium]
MTEFQGANQWVAYLTLVTREVRRFMRIWVQTLVPAGVNALLYFVIFGSLIGSRVGELQGVRYIDYLVPGIVLMSVILNSYNNVVSSFFSAKQQRYLEEILVSPMASVAVLAGYVSGGVVRGLCVGVIVLAVASVFSDVDVHNPVAVCAYMVLTATLFATLGLMNAVFARNFDDISIVPNFVLTPLTYFGGVFYSISLLPPFWQGLSELNPLFYIINGFRHSMLGVADITSGVALSVTTALVCVALGLAWWMIDRGIRIKS